VRAPIARVNEHWRAPDGVCEQRWQSGMRKPRGSSAPGPPCAGTRVGLTGRRGAPLVAFVVPSPPMALLPFGGAAGVRQLRILRCIVGGEWSILAHVPRSTADLRLSQVDPPGGAGEARAMNNDAKLTSQAPPFDGRAFFMTAPLRPGPLRGRTRHGRAGRASELKRQRRPGAPVRARETGRRAERATAWGPRRASRPSRAPVRGRWGSGRRSGASRRSRSSMSLATRASWRRMRRAHSAAGRAARRRGRTARAGSGAAAWSTAPVTAYSSTSAACWMPSGGRWRCNPRWPPPRQPSRKPPLRARVAVHVGDVIEAPDGGCPRRCRQRRRPAPRARRPRRRRGLGGGARAGAARAGLRGQRTWGRSR
jgi:hypothetical protein